MIPKLKWKLKKSKLTAKFLGYDLILTRANYHNDPECDEYGGGGWWNPAIKAPGTRGLIRTEAGKNQIEPLNIAKLDALLLVLNHMADDVFDELDSLEESNNKISDLNLKCLRHY